MVKKYFIIFIYSYRAKFQKTYLPSTEEEHTAGDYFQHRHHNGSDDEFTSL
jgi:hypothetical protein